jgi:hypothetical protein
MNRTQLRQPKGTENGGQFAASSNPESTVDLSDIGEFVSDGETPAPPATVGATSIDVNSPMVVNRWTFENKEIDGHSYQVARANLGNDVVRYSLHNSKEGGGWSLEYDELTRRVEVRGVRPLTTPSPAWRDRGEADIRKVMKELEPNARLINLDRKTYLVDGPSWPLSESHISGISTGEMMMTGGKFDEDGLRGYVAQQRRDFDKKESERPDLFASINENRRYVDGIELAADIGAEAAMANTVGAMRERGL